MQTCEETVKNITKEHNSRDNNRHWCLERGNFSQRRELTDSSVSADENDFKHNNDENSDLLEEGIITRTEQNVLHKEIYRTPTEKIEIELL